MEVMTKVNKIDSVSYRDWQSGKIKSKKVDELNNLTKADKNANFICKARSQNIFLLMENKS